MMPGFHHRFIVFVRERRRHLPFAALVAATVLVHLTLFLNSAPNVFPDTGSYNVLAEAILKREWSDGFTFRTPGYPLFLATVFSVFGLKNWQAVMAFQYMFAASVPILLYAVFLPITRKPALAAAGAAALFLDRYSMALPAVPLTEFLSGYTALVAIVSYVWASRRQSYGIAALVGLLALANILVRPSFQYLFICVALAGLGTDLLSRERRIRWRRSLAWNALFLLTLQVGMWGWSFVLYSHTGVFGLSHQLGGSMTNHTGTMMELAPDKYAKIRDIYVEERTKRNGNHINLFDEIGWKISDATGLNRWQLALEFRKINSYLIWHHPDRYFQQVGHAWYRMWTDDSHYITDITDPIGSETGRFERTRSFRFITGNALLRFIYQQVENLVWNNRALLVSIPYLMLAGFGLLVWVRRRDDFAVLALLLIPGTVFYHMLAHACVQYTEFGRYKLPVQGLWFSSCIMAGIVLVGEAVARVRKMTVPDSHRREKPAPQRDQLRGNRRRSTGRRGNKSPADGA
jgi:hypothetical protein